MAGAQNDVAINGTLGGATHGSAGTSLSWNIGLVHNSQAIFRFDLYGCRLHPALSHRPNGSLELKKFRGNL